MRPIKPFSTSTRSTRIFNKVAELRFFTNLNKARLVDNLDILNNDNRVYLLNISNILKQADEQIETELIENNLDITENLLTDKYTEFIQQALNDLNVNYFSDKEELYQRDAFLMKTSSKEDFANKEVTYTFDIESNLDNPIKRISIQRYDRGNLKFETSQRYHTTTKNITMEFKEYNTDNTQYCQSSINALNVTIELESGSKLVVALVGNNDKDSVQQYCIADKMYKNGRLCNSFDIKTDFLPNELKL